MSLVGKGNTPQKNAVVVCSNGKNAMTTLSGSPFFSAYFGRSESWSQKFRHICVSKLSDIDSIDSSILFYTKHHSIPHLFLSAADPEPRKTGPAWGVPCEYVGIPKNGWFMFVSNGKILRKWVITRSTPILGNHHMFFGIVGRCSQMIFGSLSSAEWEGPPVICQCVLHPYDDHNFSAQVALHLPWQTCEITLQSLEYIQVMPHCWGNKLTVILITVLLSNQCRVADPLVGYIPNSGTSRFPRDHWIKKVEGGDVPFAITQSGT